MDSETAANVARRLASIQRWTALANYVMMYPEAAYTIMHGEQSINSRLYDKEPPTVEEFLIWLTGRITMHAGVINNMMTQGATNAD